MDNRIRDFILYTAHAGTTYKQYRDGALAGMMVPLFLIGVSFVEEYEARPFLRAAGLLGLGLLLFQLLYGMQLKKRKETLAVLYTYRVIVLTVMQSCCLLMYVFTWFHSEKKLWLYALYLIADGVAFALNALLVRKRLLNGTYSRWLSGEEKQNTKPVTAVMIILCTALALFRFVSLTNKAAFSQATYIHVLEILLLIILLFTTLGVDNFFKLHYIRKYHFGE